MRDILSFCQTFDRMNAQMRNGNDKYSQCLQAAVAVVVRLGMNMERDPYMNDSSKYS